MHLSDKIKDLRKKDEITQKELAEKIFVSRQTISNWENNKSYPSMEFVHSISNLFNVSIDSLIKEDVDEVKSIILCKILYNVLTVSYLRNLIYFLIELSHSSCKSIRTAPINRLAEAWLGKIRMIFSLLRTFWFRRSRRLVLFSRL